MKTYVIHHSADNDGIFCREIARKFLPDAELIGWDYGYDTPVIPDDARLYMLDISIGDTGLINQDGLMHHPNLIWIDHHKSAIEKFPKDIPGYRIDGVAACRLAWQWFVASERHKAQGGNDPKWFATHYPFPTKADFVERKVAEPLAVRLAGEYDIWDKRDPDAELFQHGLRSQDLNENMLDLMLVNMEEHADGVVDCGTITVRALLENGLALQYASTKENASVIKEIGFTLKWEGLTFLACNAARYNSHLFTEGLMPEHDACFGFKWTGKDWSVSLYHAPGKEHHDLSTIAVKYGGGGHRGAAGMRLKTLPFVTNL